MGKGRGLLEVQGKERVFGEVTGLDGTRSCQSRILHLSRTIEDPVGFLAGKRQTQIWGLQVFKDLRGFRGEGRI